MRHPSRSGRGPTSDLEQLQPMQDQNAMLDACEAGDVAKLSRLFKAAGVRQGDHAFDPFFGEPVPASGPPPTCTMLAAAVAHHQPTVVTFLLNTYRSVKMDRDTVANAILAHPHRATLETLHAHTPSIVNFEFQEGHTTLLMESCKSADPFLPTLLLELGASATEADLAGTGPLSYAVKYLQPFETVVMMVERGAVITGSVIHNAIQRQHSEILAYLLERGNLDRPKVMLKEAEDTGNKIVAGLVWERAKRGEKSPLKRVRRKGGGGGGALFLFEERVGKGRGKWWQL